MSDDVLVIDSDPDPTKPHSVRERPVVVRLDQVPPRAQSHGWGDMSWTRR